MEFDEVAFLKRRNVSLFLDVGANIGQTGRRLHKAGWQGRICSFEPIPECFAKLKEVSDGHPHWQSLNYALGDVSGPSRIGVSENRVSSSIRPATEALLAIHPPIRYVRHADITVVRLDEIFGDLASAEDVTHLKIDTQGFEREVINGAEGVLDRIGSVRMEIAVSEVYAGEITLPDAVTMMSERGFVLIEAWPAWRNPLNGEVLHFDLLFRREESAA